MWIAALTWAGCQRPSAGPPPSVPLGPAAWLKGQLHAHTNRSPDGDAPPQDVAAWYARHGFDFLVFTDHNEVTVAPAGEPCAKMVCIPGVELTQRLWSCEGSSEEPCIPHVNALFVNDPKKLEGWSPLKGPTRLAIYEEEVATTRALGAVAQLNHPNYGRGADAAILSQLVRDGLQFFEVENANGLSRDEGGAGHASTEQIWDTVLSEGLMLYGTATDDAHHFDEARDAGVGSPSMTGGHAWVMVHAQRDASAIREALLMGRFYASTGVALERAGLSADGQALEVEVSHAAGPHRIEVIVAGHTVEVSQSPSLRFALSRAPGQLVRAVVTGAEGKAWVEPVKGQTPRPR
jgi:hypothetical protein